VSHLQVVTDDAPRSRTRNIRYSAAENPVQGAGALRAAAAGGPPPEVDDDGQVGLGGAQPPLGDMQPPLGGVHQPPAEAPPEDVPQQPVRVEKTPGRNEPCWCGSGKKYKLCHGR
jgi:hypothetical protein